MCMYVHVHIYDTYTYIYIYIYVYVYIFHDEEQNSFFTIYFIHLMSKVIMSQNIDRN